MTFAKFYNCWKYVYVILTTESNIPLVVNNSLGVLFLSAIFCKNKTRNQIYPGRDRVLPIWRLVKDCSDVLAILLKSNSVVVCMQTNYLLGPMGWVGTFRGLSESRDITCISLHKICCRVVYEKSSQTWLHVLKGRFKLLELLKVRMFPAKCASCECRFLHSFVHVYRNESTYMPSVLAFSLDTESNTILIGFPVGLCTNVWFNSTILVEGHIPAPL